MDNYNKKIKEYLNLYNEGMFGDAYNKFKAGAKHMGKQALIGVGNIAKNALRVGAHVGAGAFGIPLPNKGFMKMRPLDYEHFTDRNKIYKNLRNTIIKYKLVNLLDDGQLAAAMPGINVTMSPHNRDNYNLLTNHLLSGKGNDSVYYIDLFDQIDDFNTEHLRRRASRNNRQIKDYKNTPEGDFIKWLFDKANPPTKG